MPEKGSHGSLPPQGELGLDRPVHEFQQGPSGLSAPTPQHWTTTCGVLGPSRPQLSASKTKQAKISNALCSRSGKQLSDFYNSNTQLPLIQKPHPGHPPRATKQRAPSLHRGTPAALPTIAKAQSRHGKCPQQANAGPKRATSTRRTPLSHDDEQTVGTSGNGRGAEQGEPAAGPQAILGPKPGGDRTEMEVDWWLRQGRGSERAT